MPTCVFIDLMSAHNGRSRGWGGKGIGILINIIIKAGCQKVRGSKKARIMSFICKTKYNTIHPLSMSICTQDVNSAGYTHEINVIIIKLYYVYYIYFGITLIVLFIQLLFIKTLQANHRRTVSKYDHTLHSLQNRASALKLHAAINQLAENYQLKLKVTLIPQIEVSQVSFHPSLLCLESQWCVAASASPPTPQLYNSPYKLTSVKYASCANRFPSCPEW